MNEKLSFTVDDARLIKEDPNSSFSLIALDFFASGDNLHNLYVTESNLLRTANTIKNCPVVWKYDSIHQDAANHSLEEVPCGVIPESAEIKSRKLSDGRTMLTTVAIVWKKYSGKILDFFKRDGQKPISVEMTVLNSGENDKGQNELFDYKFEAVTVLSNLITPAIPLAHATVLQFAKEYQDAYMREFSNKYIDIDFTIPKELKSAAKKSLDTYKSSGESANSASLAMGRFIINNEKITVDKLRSMAKYFNGKTERTDIAIGFYGGRFASKWSKEMINKINEIDEKRLSYFNDSEVLTFPYKNIGDAPPSIQKLDGVALTAVQASEIAAQADKIGGEYAWPTAIKSWKSRHKIDNDHWVKKENSTEKEEKFVNEDNEKLEEMAEIPVENKDKTEVEMSDEKPVEEMAKEDVKPEEKEGSEEKPKDKDGEEPKEEKMSSLDQNIDIAALLQMLVEETEDNKILAEKYKAGEEIDYSMLCSAMYKKMCKMQADSNAAKEDKDVYMSENVKLKEYKDTIEKQQFSCAVEKTLQEVSDSLSKEEINNARETAKSLNLDTLAAWQNDIRSLAFSYIKNNSKKKESFTRMATVNSWLTKNDEPEDAIKKYAQNGWL